MNNGWMNSFPVCQARLNQAKREDRMRKDRERKAEDRQDPVYNAAMRERDRLRLLTRGGNTPAKKGITV